MRSNNIGQQIAKNIVKRRKELNITQEKLAESSDLSINFISRIERGVSTHISADTLFNISKALNFSMENLITDSEESFNHPGPNQARLNQYLAKLDLSKSEKLCQQVLDMISNYHLN